MVCFTAIFAVFLLYLIPNEKDKIYFKGFFMERYKIAKYGQWWWGIIDTNLNDGAGLFLRKGSEADPYKPISENNKLLLFKSKDEAQEYIDKTLQDNLTESKKKSEIKPIFAKWDNDRKCIIVSNEEYDRWDD